MINGETSFWWRDIGRAEPREPLKESISCDVAIVGGGFTGLWTAWYLKQASPDLRVVVLEKEFCGFGASGRNGGWLSGLLAGSRERWASEFGRDGVVAAQREMFRTVEEVRDFCIGEGVDCDLVVGGSLDVARSEPALARLREKIAWQRSWGFGEEDWRELGRDELEVDVDGALGGVYTPHCARVHPAKLVRGLAAACERIGVEIFERTEVCRIGVDISTATRHRVRARSVVRATEGYSHALAPRSLIPMNSSMIVTAPVPQLAWKDGMTVRDAAHTFVYIQRTADGRIAIGGRGKPYRYGSKTDANGEISQSTVRELTRRLHTLFPFTEAVEVPHAWGGVLGVSRDWCPAVTQDGNLLSAGGYVGDGVSTTNLAGRTLRDLILGEDTELTRAPWARHRSPRWEPEPLRWTGVHTVYSLYRAADAMEERTHRPSRLAALADRIAGR